jgi:uncharacterized protein
MLLLHSVKKKVLLMNVLDHFSIPYQGLKNGMHTLHFKVDEGFFESFENSIVKSGVFDVEMELDKRPDLSIATFNCDGHVVLPCDRCLLDFELPLSVDFTIHIKYGEPTKDDDEVLFLDPETSHINVAQHIYEWICISLPMVRTHEEVSDCDPEMIRKLTQSDEADNNEDTSIWASLKNNFKADN